MSIYDLCMFEMNPKADEKFVIKGERYRITVLTEQMLRLEYSEDGVFEDRATRLAFNRSFAQPEYTTYYEDGFLHVDTKHLRLIYDEKPFSDSGLQIYVDGNRYWYYGQKTPTLGGTFRTLDGVYGARDIPAGILSDACGVAAVDDSHTIAIGDDGWPAPVIGNRTDLYFFGYNYDFEKCIKDFYRLSNPVPLLPRYTLGNWWSRYYKYSEESYLALVDKFKEKHIPLSVGVIDMDWHIVDTPDPVRYGSGWTGYTWNKELFPDYKRFLAGLHERKIKTTLNLHPKDGIRAFEEVYSSLCDRLGKDKENGRPIEFDVSDRRFLEGYFDTVLNPMEDNGVDFWWIDWQQRGGMRIAGYDSLWMLNHCHYVDNARRGKRPLTLSRYAEIGSHRYPLGFSGDTDVSWESLDFQPYFTATAANVGFSWWSHDIGGHLKGKHDNELQTRWVQYGVFSPVMRLHSSPSDFTSKEPWNYGECEGVQSDFLRLRHKLIPYIYTMMYRNSKDGIPMVRPLYHKYSRERNAYVNKNEYFFGDLISAPITSKRDAETRLARVKVWLPRGKYIDFFSGRIYSGDRFIDCYRTIEDFPLFAKAGLIIPLSGEYAENGTDNPARLELNIYGGDSGSFTMIEDNDRASDSTVIRTEYSFSYGAESVFVINAPASLSVVPKNREYTLHFFAFSMPERVEVNGAEWEFTFNCEKNEITLTPFTVAEGESVEIKLYGDGKLPQNEVINSAFKLLLQSQISTAQSDIMMALLRKGQSREVYLTDLLSRDVPEGIKGALIELVCAN